MSKSIKANAFFKTLMSIVNIIFPLLTAPYVARVLSVDGFTEYNKIANMLTWFSPFAVFGIYTYGMRTISQIKNDHQAVSQLFTKLLIYGILTSVFFSLVYICVVFVTPEFANYKGIYSVAVIQLLFVFFATDWANEAYENYGFILVKTFICRLLYVISVFIFVNEADDLSVYVLLSSLALVINNVLTFAYAKCKIEFSKVSIKEVLSLTKPLGIVFLLENSSMLYTIFDRFVLTWWGDKLELTYYNISQMIIMSLTSVTSSVLMVSIPRLSFLWAGGQKEEYYEIQRKTANTFIALQAPCCIGVACLSAEVIFYYAGTNYLAAHLCMLFFSVRYCISAFDKILSNQMLLATGNEKVLAKIYYIGGIYNILCKIILIMVNKLTPELCILTTASADVFIIVLQLISIKKIGIHIDIFSIKSLKYVLISLVFIPITLLVKHIIPFDETSNILIRTTIIVSACALVYAGFLFFTKDKIMVAVFNKRKNGISK